MVALSTCLKCFKQKKATTLWKNNQSNKQNMKKKKIILAPNVKFRFKHAKRLILIRKKLANLKMSKDCLQVLLGTLLGDGSLKINKNYVNARFAMRHAIRYANWFYWKANKLSELASNKAIHVQKPSKGSYTKTDMLRFQTLTKPELTIVHSIVTKNNTMSIRRRWLNHLTPLALMCWWLDDGALIANWRQGCFCCEGFSKKEQNILVQYLKTVWRVNARVVRHPIKQKDKNKKVINSYMAFRIKLGTTELKKFLRIIMPFIPCEDMVYKVCVRYDDPTLQQRWISELKKALPQFSLAIDKFYFGGFAKP